MINSNRSNQKKMIFVGVDGGATKCQIRFEDATGKLLGTAKSGPANIRLSVEKTWQSIRSAFHAVVQSLQINLHDYEFHAGMGLAGCESTEAYERFLSQNQLFSTLVVVSDAHIACLGAHRGKEGAIIIVGTGVVGLQIQSSKITRVSGWGFPHDDEGGGAWMGLEAVRKTLQYLDGRGAHSGLVEAVYAYFNRDQEHLVNWANQANSTVFAELAPLVVTQMQAGDEMAQQLFHQAAIAIQQVAQALSAKQGHASQPWRCSLVGGMAPFLLPYLGSALKECLHDAESSPDAGAILLLRDYLALQKDEK